MNYSSHQWGPTQTPTFTKWLIIVTATITLVSALSTPLFNLANLTGPQQWLSLSWFGLQNLYLWQLISYLFIQDASGGGIQVFFLLSLFFNMYILWILGSTLCEDIGQSHFLTIYLSVGALSGFITVFTAYLLGQYPIIYGPSVSLLALFTVWTMLYKDSILALFFIIPFKAKSLLAGILILIAVVSLSNLDFPNFIFYLSGAFLGYLYGVIILNLEAPFTFMEPLDKLLGAIHEWLFRKGVSSDGKIVNLNGEAVLRDDEFIDAMLTKITKYGEQALTSRERKRMKEISERKKRDK